MLVELVGKEKALQEVVNKAEHRPTVCEQEHGCAVTAHSEGEKENICWWQAAGHSHKSSPVVILPHAYNVDAHFLA